jgi:hypothetical protein
VELGRKLLITTDQYQPIIDYHNMAKRMVTHLNRRSQRKYHRPKGMSHYQHLQDLGLERL